MTNARIRVRRALAATAVATLCVAPLAACGGSDTDTKSKDSTSSSSSSDSHDHLTKENFFSEVVDAMVDKKSAHMSMDMAQAKVNGDVEYDGKDTKMHMQMGVGAQKFEIVLADQTMYMKAPGMTQGNKWVKFDKNTKGFGQFVEQMGDMDLASQVENMQKGLKKLEYVGDEKIDGESYEKYKLTVDTKTAMQGKTLPPGTPATMTYTMLLDDDHLVRRMEMDISGQHIAMDMTDWGKDVDVTVPKDSEVMDFKMPSAPQ